MLPIQFHPAHNDVSEFVAMYSLRPLLRGAGVSVAEDEVMEIRLGMPASAALAHLPALQLRIRPEVMFQSRAQTRGVFVPAYNNVEPTGQRADWDTDEVLPLLRPKVPAPENRPWVYYAKLKENIIRVFVYGAADVVNLNEHHYSCYNGVYIRRENLNSPPTLFGVVSIEKPTWYGIANHLRLNPEQCQVLTMRGAVAVSHGRLPEDGELFEALNEVENGTPVSPDDVMRIVDYAYGARTSISREATKYRHDRVDDQVYEGLTALQSAVKYYGLATPLTSWAIEQWLYHFMSHPHKLNVSCDAPDDYGWEGPQAEDHRLTRGVLAIRVDTRGNSSFETGVQFNMMLPALTGSGLDSLRNNLDEFLPQNTCECGIVDDEYTRAPRSLRQERAYA